VIPEGIKAFYKERKGTGDQFIFFGSLSNKLFPLL